MISTADWGDVPQASTEYMRTTEVTVRILIATGCLGDVTDFELLVSTARPADLLLAEMMIQGPDVCTSCRHAHSKRAATCPAAYSQGRSWFLNWHQLCPAAAHAAEAYARLVRP